MKKKLYQKIESLLELDPNRGYDILDLGCGGGDLLGNLSASIAPGSTLVGIDASEPAIESAAANYPRVDFVRHRFVDALDFDDDSFDLVVSVDLVECIPNKTALLDEVFRILKPGGRVLFAHWDWDTQVYNSDNRSGIRKLVAAFSDWQQDWMEAADGQMGRRLWGLFQGSGRYDGVIESFTLIETEYREGRYGFDRLRDLSILAASGGIEAAEYETICREMQTLAERNQYFYSLNAYIYLGEPRKM